MMAKMKTVPAAMDMLYTLANTAVKKGDCNIDELCGLDHLAAIGYAEEINGYYIITGNGMIVAINLRAVR